MHQILVAFLKWVGKKCLVLLCIVGVLLIGYWVKSEWSGLSHKIDAFASADSKINQRKNELADLNQKMESLAQEARGRLAKFKSLDDAADAAEAKAEDLRKKYQNLKNVTWFFEWPMWSDRAKKEWEAQQAYELARTGADVARKAADHFSKNQESSPEAKLQKQINDKDGELTRAMRDKELLQDENTTLLQRLFFCARDVLPTASWILVGIIVTPVALKFFLYWVVAPFVGRVPPVIILPNSSAPEIPFPIKSGVSVPVAILPGQELLVHPDFLQSSSNPAQKRTQFFLNPTLPFTSIASRLYLLTRIRPEGEVPTNVVLSAQHDPLGEMGMIELPEGATMVIQPRSLAGVLKPVKGLTHISRHWRLRNLHSWLTLQLRFLVFHGPCKLILKGCRGVRAESPEVDNPRLINQSATLGFSANFDYSNTRCETFISYLRGKEDLFNDLFAGGPGIYVYEEMPDVRYKGGLTGRGLEGFLDSTLKVFGI
jgi:hypothetical protein